MSDALPRPYSAGDLTACLAAFDSNVPDYFAPDERAEFDAFLRGLAATTPYLVLTQNSRIVACGGLLADCDRQASFAWGMVHRSLHRQGLGRQLTQVRLDQARAMPGITRVRLSTSQHTYGFYAGFGFTVTGITPDGLAPGLHCYEMVLRLD